MTAQQEWLYRRKSRAKPKEPGVVAGRPACPESVKSDPDALAEWKRLCRLLAARGTLSKGDAPFLELYCSTYSTWLAARAEIKARGLFVDVPVTDAAGEVHFKRAENPARKVEAQCVTAMRQFLAGLGATPVTRERAKPTKEVKKRERFVPGSVGELLADSEEEEAPQQEVANDGDQGIDVGTVPSLENETGS